MTSRIEEVISYLRSIEDVDFSGQEARRGELQDALSRLLSRIKSPIEQAWALMLEGPGLFAAIRTLMDIGLFERWTATGGKEITLEEAQSLSVPGTETNLLRRLFRLLSSLHILEEVDEDTWRPSAFSIQLGYPEGHVAQTIRFGEHHIMGPVQNLPKFLEETAYREPLESNSGNYKSLYGLDFFARCRSDKKFQTSFIKGLQVGLATQKFDWTDIYDTRDLIAGFNDNVDSSVCFVDVGGAHGIDTSYLLRKHPRLPTGSLVIEDLPDVIDLTRVDPVIKLLTHDFFTEQPVKGSRAYFTHAIIHDWKDEDARRILHNIAKAMTRGYSKLLLYECVLPKTGASPLLSAIDIGLMYACASYERSRYAWEKLLSDVGLKTVHIWSHPMAYESVIEAELI